MFNKNILDLHSQFIEMIDKEMATELHRVDIVPMFYDENLESYKSKYLYVGINPSLTSQNFRFLNELGLAQFSEFLKLTEEEKKNRITKIISQQHDLIYGKNQIPYFKQVQKTHQDIFGNENNDWMHYDLFPIRTTDPKPLLKILKNPLLKDYKVQSIERFYRLIDDGKLKAVLVLNLDVAKILKNSLGANMSLEHSGNFRNPIYGAYKFNGTPIFLFKQLTGGGTSQKELKQFIKLIRDVMGMEASKKVVIGSHGRASGLEF